MSLIESAPQKQKEYDPRKQDHGDAAEQRGHVHEDFFGDKKREAFAKSDAHQMKLDMRDTEPQEGLTSEELEAAANIILGEEPTLSYSSEDAYVEADPVDQDPDDDYDPDNPDGEENLDETDPFATEAQLGLKSKHEIARAMARRVTLDVDFDDDDDGDSDYAVPVHIKNRL